jgi:uncharacterized protein
VSQFWREVADGVSVAVKVQPKSRRPGLRGTAPDIGGVRLRIGVTEAPEDGRASQAACAALALALGYPASAVHVLTGATSRQKTLHIAGDPGLLAERLSHILDNA